MRLLSPRGEKKEGSSSTHSSLIHSNTALPPSLPPSPPFLPPSSQQFDRSRREEGKRFPCGGLYFMGCHLGQPGQVLGLEGREGGRE